MFLYKQRTINIQGSIWQSTTYLYIKPTFNKLKLERFEGFNRFALTKLPAVRLVDSENKKVTKTHTTYILLNTVKLIIHVTRFQQCSYLSQSSRTLFSSDKYRIRFCYTTIVVCSAQRKLSQESAFGDCFLTRHPTSQCN